MNIKTRVAAVVPRHCAVLCLRLVGNEVLKIAGYIDRVRPDKVGLRRQSVPIIHLQAGLQRVINGVRQGFFFVQIFREIREVSRNAQIAHTIRQIGCRDLRLARLVDIQGLKQLGPLRTHIGNLQHGFVTELLLDIQIEVLGGAALPVLRYGLDFLYALQRLNSFAFFSSV